MLVFWSVLLLLWNLVHTKEVVLYIGECSTLFTSSLIILVICIIINDFLARVHSFYGGYSGSSCLIFLLKESPTYYDCSIYWSYSFESLYSYSCSYSCSSYVSYKVTSSSSKLLLGYWTVLPWRSMPSSISRSIPNPLNTFSLYSASNVMGLSFRDISANLVLFKNLVQE